MVKRGAEKFLPLFEQSGGKMGHLSGQVEPGLIRNEPGMIEMAEKLASLSPNVMIKVPGSTQGMAVLRYLASKGISTNATLVYTVPQMVTVARMVDEGRKMHLAGGGTPRFGWRASAPICPDGSTIPNLLRGVIDKEQSRHQRSRTPLGIHVGGQEGGTAHRQNTAIRARCSTARTACIVISTASGFTRRST